MWLSPGLFGENINPPELLPSFVPLFTENIPQVSGSRGTTLDSNSGRIIFSLKRGTNLAIILGR